MKKKVIAASLGVLFSSAAIADQVILDDLIVDGSACIGMDCVNGESFGFDTLRLKENNLRIKFQDTSASASFPSNDWQITANDSANGGANKFSIDDIDGGRTPFTIEAGAPSNSLFVDDAGRIGLGTATPVVEVQIVDGDSPTMRIEQDGSSGFTPQTWDVAGNETNFFVRDVTNGSKLPFKIRPSAPTDSFYIDTDGDIGMGKAGADAALHILRSNGNAGLLVEETSSTETDRTLMTLKNNGGNAISLEDTSADGATWSFATTSVGRFQISKAGTAAVDFVFDHNGTQQELGIGVSNPSHPIQHVSGAFLSSGGVWTDASSRSFKQDIKELAVDLALDTVKSLNPVTYRYKKELDEEYVGFIAEDVPDLVANSDRKSLSPMNVVAVLTKVVQEQMNVIAKLNKRVEQLEKVNK